MRRIKPIISIFLLLIQIISMAHIMFHHQVHALIEGEDMCVVLHNHHGSCCSGCHHNTPLNQKSSDDSCRHEESCNSDREYISNQLSQFSSDNKAVDLPLIIHSFITSTTVLSSIYYSEEYYIDISEGIPITPTFKHHSLRAPPAIC